VWSPCTRAKTDYSGLHQTQQSPFRPIDKTSPDNWPRRILWHRPYVAESYGQRIHGPLQKSSSFSASSSYPVRCWYLPMVVGLLECRRYRLVRIFIAHGSFIPSPGRHSGPLDSGIAIIMQPSPSGLRSRLRRLVRCLQLHRGKTRQGLRWSPNPGQVAKRESRP
jgi:hypothetical protein